MGQSKGSSGLWRDFCVYPAFYVFTAGFNPKTLPAVGAGGKTKLNWPFHEDFNCLRTLPVSRSCSFLPAFSPVFDSCKCISFFSIAEGRSIPRARCRFARTLVPSQHPVPCRGGQSWWASSGLLAGCQIHTQQSQREKQGPVLSNPVVGS